MARATSSSSASGGQEAETLGHLHPMASNVILNDHHLLLPGAATASTLSTPHPPWKPIVTQANPQFLPLRLTDANVNIFTQCELLICSASSGLRGAVSCTWRSCSVSMVQLFVFSPLPVNLSSVDFSLVGPFVPCNPAVACSLPEPCFECSRLSLSPLGMFPVTAFDCAQFIYVCSRRLCSVPPLRHRACDEKGCRSRVPFQ